MDDIGGYGSLKRMQWESRFKEDLEALIGLHKSRIQILDCRAASVLVEVLMLPPSSVDNVEGADPTLLVPADTASQRLSAAVAAAANDERPPASLGGMQVVLELQRLAPPAPPFNPNAQMVSSRLSVDASVSALTNELEDSDTETIAMAGFAFLAPVILAACLIWRLRRQRRLADKREDREYRKSTIEHELEELPELPDDFVVGLPDDAPSLPMPPAPLDGGHLLPPPPTPPPLDAGHALPMPPAPLDGGHSLPAPRPKLARNQVSQVLLPGAASLPAPGSAFEDDNVPHSRATLSRPTKASPSKWGSLADMYSVAGEGVDDDVEHHPALARLAKKAVAKQELLMRETIEDTSRLRKIVKQGTPIRVLQQRKGKDGEKRALITFDPPTTDRKGKVAGWVMLEMIEIEGQDGSPTSSPNVTNRSLNATSRSQSTTSRTVIGANGVVLSEEKSDDDDEHLFMALPAGFRPTKSPSKSPSPQKSRAPPVIGIVGEDFEVEEVEQTYITRITLKMRAEADMKSDPAGEMPANSHVTVREWRTLPDGTRRAHVCEVGSSPEKLGWLSCVAKDGAETLLPTTARADEEHIFLALPQTQAADSNPSSDRSTTSVMSTSTIQASHAPEAPTPTPALVGGSDESTTSSSSTPMPTAVSMAEGLPGVSKYQLIMRERMDNSSRLRKVLKKGTPVRVLRQGTASDGGKRALVTHDPPIEDYKGRVEGWVMWADKGEEFIELHEPDAVVPGDDESTTASSFRLTTVDDQPSTEAAAPVPSKDGPPRAVRRGTSTHHLRTSKGVGADIMDDFDDDFGFGGFGNVAAAAGAQNGGENVTFKEKKLAARFARGANTTASAAIAEAAEVAEARASTSAAEASASISNEDMMEQTYTTRITLKMRADADMKSTPAGEMPANSCVTVREWRALPDGTRRAHVCEVGSSPEKSGWLSCVAKDGNETLLPNTVRGAAEQISPLPSQRSFTAEASAPVAPAPAPRLSGEGRGDFERVRI